MKFISLLLSFWLFFLIVNMAIRGIVWLVRSFYFPQTRSKKYYSHRGSARENARQGQDIIDAEFKEIE
ncbi:MAG: hypothetical protein JXD21_01570 [Candidatus Omnitrophica bacterium]|nr:hypothetical protein [Candidatus Omnitrophota bacterium]